MPQCGAQNKRSSTVRMQVVTAKKRVLATLTDPYECFNFTAAMTTLYQRLSENWTAYETKKRDKGEDPSFFSCDEAWEVFFLAEKLQVLFPNFPKVTILEAIAAGCRHRTEPIMRKQFLLRVLQTLELQLKAET